MSLHQLAITHCVKRVECWSNIGCITIILVDPVASHRRSILVESAEFSIYCFHRMIIHFINLFECVSSYRFSKMLTTISNSSLHSVWSSHCSLWTWAFFSSQSNPASFFTSNLSSWNVFIHAQNLARIFSYRISDCMSLLVDPAQNAVIEVENRWGMYGVWWIHHSRSISIVSLK